MALQITDQRIAAALADSRRPGAVELFDAVEPGLSLRIREGKARWSYRTFAGGACRLRISLGGWPGVTTSRARSLARQLKSTFNVPRFEDPLAIKTVGGLLGVYQRRRLSQLRTGGVMYNAIASALASHVRRETSTISRGDIVAIVDEMADRAPIHANRLLAYLRSFFGWAVGRGYIETNPAAAISKPSREIPRDRTPTLDELVEIWNAAGALGYPFGPAIRLLVLTASRRDEVGDMRLVELQLPLGMDESEWVLPAARSKSGRAIRTPLAPLARDTLDQALAQRRVTSPFVFSTNGVTPSSGWSRAKRRLDTIISRGRLRRGVAEGMPPWRIHDLRRAFATAACDVLKIDPTVTDRCLNHVGSATASTVSRIYARAEMYEQRRAALTQWSALIGKAIAAAAREGPEPG